MTLRELLNQVSYLDLETEVTSIKINNDKLLINGKFVLRSSTLNDVNYNEELMLKNEEIENWLTPEQKLSIVTKIDNDNNTYDYLNVEDKNIYIQELIHEVIEA